MTKKEDNEVKAKQRTIKYWTEDIQRVKKILSDPKSISLEYTYKGETLKGDSSIPHGKGEKQFKEPESFKELEEIVVDGRLLPMTYDLEFLKCLKGDVAQGFFYNYETRISEYGYYVNANRWLGFLDGTPSNCEPTHLGVRFVKLDSYGRCSLLTRILLQDPVFKQTLSQYDDSLDQDNNFLRAIATRHITEHKDLWNTNSSTIP